MQDASEGQGIQSLGNTHMIKQLLLFTGEHISQVICHFYEGGTGVFLCVITCHSILG